jgi:DNA repair exonuclease SbcCD ATPase subunit
MIATAQALSAAFSRRVQVLALALVPCLLGACAVERETTIARAARSRQVGAQRAERQRQEQDLALLRQTAGQTEAEITAATRRSVEVAAALRTVAAQLQYELGVLQQAEGDLATARARAQQIEAELQPLRALEQTLRDQEALRSAAAVRLSTLQPEVEALQLQVSQREAELLPRLQALQRQATAQQQLAAVLTAAEKALAEALAPLAPPAPAAPTTAPVGK